MSEEPFDLYRWNILPEIIGLMPESVARENGVIPVDVDWRNGLVVAMANPDQDTLAKLRFILNRPLTVVPATAEAIRFALERYYPQP